MFLQLQQESLLIGKRPTGFTEHYYTEWDDGLGKEKIALFMVLSVGSTQVPGAEIGREAFQLLQDHFLHDLSGDPYDRFESALREINLMVNQKEKELDLTFIPNMNMICGVIQKDLLFLSQRGEARGYLIRKRHVSSITDELYDERNKEDLFQNIASGILEVGDTVVFTTAPLIQYVTPSDLSKIFSEQSLAEAGKEMRDLLHADLEEQVALLSFEILEKTESVETASEPVQVAEIEEEPKPKDRSKAREQLGSSLKVLRDWAMHEDRWRFVTRLREMDRPRLLKMALAVLVVLVIGLFLLSRDNGAKKELAAMTTQLDTAEDYVAQAGTKGTFDKDAARELLEDAETLTREVLNSGYLKSDADVLLEEIEEQRNVLDNVIVVDDEKLKLLVDFSDLIGDDIIRGVVLQDSKHIVYSSGEIYEVSIDEVGSPTVLDSTEAILDGTFFADQAKVAFLLANGSVAEYVSGNVQFADSVDGTWKQGTDLASYSSRVYVLDAEEGQIWKVQRGSSAYGAPQAYVDAEKVDLTSAVALAIDGNVWVLEDDGTLLQLLSGEEVNFDIKNAPSASMSESTQIWADAETKDIYVLNPVSGVIFDFQKDAKTDDLIYKAQYFFKDLKGDLVDFYYDKDREVLVLVTKTALYEAAL